MATIDISSALNSIAQSKIAPLYFLIGEERYFYRRFIEQVRHFAVTDDLREFNEDIFYAHEVDVERVVQAVRTLPLMSDKRLVILKEAHALSEKDWAQLETLGSLFSSTDNGTILVIQAHQVDRRKKTIKKWIDQATVIECNTPPEADRAGWIRALAEEKKLELDREALMYLAQMGGNSLEEIERDLDKLFLFIGKPHQVSIGEVAQVLQRSREENIFSLSESVGKKDRPQALFLFHRLKSQGENEIALVALIARHLRILLKTKVAQKSGVKGTPALAQKVGVNSYFLPSYLQQASLWKEEELSQSLLSLAQIDKQLKSSPLPPDLWLEHFLLFSPEAS